MKKLLLIMIVLLVSGAINAQGSKGKLTNKSFLAFHVGPSFPMGDFGSTNFDNQNAGFAKTGYSLNLTYGYKLVQNFGLTASLFYNNNGPDNAAIEKGVSGSIETDVFGKMNHWQWVGLTAGPMITQNLGSNVEMDLRIMGGVADANFPKVFHEDTIIVNQDWSFAAIFHTGLDLRIGIGNGMFIFTNLDYQYMKPKFNLVFPDESPTIRSEQKMSVLNLTGGLGIRF